MTVHRSANKLMSVLKAVLTSYWVTQRQGEIAWCVLANKQGGRVQSRFLPGVAHRRRFIKRTLLLKATTSHFLNMNTTTQSASEDGNLALAAEGK